MKKTILKYRLAITGLFTGAIAGWCYWYFVGCASGNCPISSSPLNSSVYWAAVGALSFSMLKRQTTETEKQ